MLPVYLLCNVNDILNMVLCFCSSLAQSVKVMIAVAIFFTYALQFYVPMEIIWKSIGPRFGAHKRAAEYIVRGILVLGTGECQYHFAKIMQVKVKVKVSLHTP